MGTDQQTPVLDQQVPAHCVTELAHRRHPYCLCVFVLNEGERIIAQLAKMRPFAGQVDIIVADGGSTDGALACANLEAGRVRSLLVKTGPGRLSAQMRMGLAYALDQGYQGVITMDGNDKDDPAAVPLFIQALEQGFDHVQGSRFVPGGIEENTPLSRRLGVRLVHAPVISLAAGQRYTDTTNGFRAYSRRLLLDPRVAPFREVFVAYELHYYLAIRAARLGYRVTEVPVARRYPSKGSIPTKISPIKGSLQVLHTLFAAALGRFDPHP
jgi:dolichol-phosphate mannosyltransferase